MPKRQRKSEYEGRAKKFRDKLKRQSRKVEGQQDFPEVEAGEDWPAIEARATCHTPGCKVEGQAFPANLHENADGIYRVYCGHCSNPHSDVVLLFEEEEEELPAKRLPKPVREVGPGGD